MVPQHPIMTTADHPSMSLRPTTKEMYATLREQFSKLHSPSPPPKDVHFSPPPYCKVIDSATNQPVTVTSEVTEIVGWPSEDGSKIRFEISAPATNLNEFWAWMNRTFGVDGLIAASLEQNYTAMGKLVGTLVGEPNDVLSLIHALLRGCSWKEQARRGRLQTTQRVYCQRSCVRGWPKAVGVSAANQAARRRRRQQVI